MFVVIADPSQEDERRQDPIAIDWSWPSETGVSPYPRREQSAPAERPAARALGRNASAGDLVHAFRSATMREELRRSMSRGNFTVGGSASR